MNTVRAFVLLLIATTLAACGTAGQTPAPQPTVTPTAPQPTVTPTAPQPTVTPPSPPTVSDNAFAAILGPVDAPAGWTVQPCEGSGPHLCVSANGAYVGTVELAVFPLETMTDFQKMLNDAGLSPEALNSQDPEDRAKMVAALQAFVAQYYTIFEEDRSASYPEDVAFTPLSPEEIEFGSLPGVAYGFAGIEADGSARERWLLYSTFDGEALYTIVAFYDPSSDVGTFRSDAELVQFAPHLRTIVSNLRLENLPREVDPIGL